MSLLFEGIWGDLIFVLGNLVWFFYFKISNFILNLILKFFVIIYYFSEYGI